VTVKGTSTILFQSKNVTAQINGAWVGSGATMRAVNIQVDATGKISADGQGYGAGMGPGSTTGTVYSGGSFGGKGSGTAAGATYGSAQTPTDPGSGGGQYYSSVSNGGGVIRLIVSGTLTNNGVISANGSGSGNNSGASGGSVWVTTGTLAGSGIFTANGYDGTYSKGGGGRVAVYYRTNSGYSGFATSTAVATPDATNGSIAFLDNSPTNHRLYVYQQFPFFSDTIAIYDSITVDNGGTLSIGGGSDISVTGTITVKGNSTILTQSRNNSSQANATLRAGNIQVDAGSRISADGEGYGAGKGAGTSTDVYSGGSYGGKGSGTAAGAIYGSAQTPTEPGSGGGPYGSSVSNGGGAMLLLVAGTLTNNGTISSNGSGSAPGSGASGGSILVSTKTLAGSGIITANGSVGTYSQGGGGRVAVYYLEMDTVQSFNLASITAGGSGTAQPGSVLISNSPHFSWIRPVSDLMHDTVRLEWAALAVDFLTTTVDIVASRATAQNVIGARLNSNSGVDWDTRSVADGQYELRLIFRDANGLVLGEAPRSVLVNNSVKWHLGTIAVSETWSTDKIHGIEGTLIIPAGVTITVDPGTVIKAQKGARIVVQDGGIFNALGTDVSRIILTALDDDSVGGDTNFDGSQTKPLPGEWFGFGIQGSGQFNLNTFTDLRYMQTVRSGTLSANETWLGSYLYHVTGDVVVPSGVTLTIEPGAIIKFDVVKGITVQSGGRLVANGTIAEPIYFTSIKDDSVGGDTNGDGNTTSPSAGDWQWLYINGGQASFNHAVINYGGGNSYGSWNGTGVILTSGSAAVTVANSVIRQSFYDGILAWGGTVEVTNTVLTGIDRAVCAHPGSPVKVTNCTLDGNRIGLLVHGGTMDVVNTIVANSSSAGIQYDYGTLNSVRYSDVWTSVPGAVNYSPGPDLSGSNGNISVSPLFKNRAQGDYRLDYHSPAIDAADGAVVPVTDVMGAPRYDDPRTLNTGTATAMGAYSDMGAYEFVESADSDVDLVVSGVTGPASALVGSQVQLSWTVTNNGTGYAVGPWHDAVYLVRNPDAAKVEIFVGETIVGQNVILGPGQSFIATAIVTVPGSEIGAHRWEIMANSRGELFEGKNSGNNSGVSAAKVTIDLQELVVDAPSLPGLFTAAGQSFWYKMTPGVNKDIKVSLAIGANAGTGQLYIGQGYLPDRQHYDFTQQEWNSAVATAQVPGSASQVYYVLAYDPTLSSASANFTLAAKTSTFSVTTVQPGFVSNNGTATLEITGGQLSTRAQFSLVSPNSTVYNPLYLFVADPSHAYATFNLTGLATGGYGMQVTDNGSTVTEANAVTVIAGSGSLIEYSIITPKAVRAGGSGTATVTYKNVGGTDAMAPLMWLTASGANLGHIDPFCMNVPGGLGYDAVSDTTMLRCQELKKQNTFTSGKILGINNEGPAGILPPGAGGSVSFEMDPVITSDYVDFTVSDVSDPDTPMDWNGLKNSMKPVFVPVEAWDAVFANMSSTIGSTMGQFNAALAADATYLSSFGRYESKANNLISFELMKAGLATIIPRYTLGSFGRGASHPFDISGEIQDGNIVLHYPVGNIRQLKLDSVITGKYNGIGGDYGVLTVNSTDQSWNLTEIDGTLSHFKVDPNNAVQYVIDFIQDLNGNKVSVNYTGSVVTSITSTTGDTQQFSYNSQGRINQTIDAVGRISTYSYDTSGEHLLSVTVPRGTTSFTYVTGQGAASEHAVGSITYPDGTSRSFEYDSMGRLTKKSLNGGVETLTLAYEASGAVTVTDATGSSTRILPDEYGQIGQIDDPLGAVTRFSYDPWHNLISVQAPEGTSVSFGYDAHGNRTTLFDPAGNRQNFGYGSYGNLISLTDSLDNMLGYSYDTRDNNTAITYPDGSAAKAEYDVRGNLLKWTNRRGRSVVYAYDTYNLLTRKTHADGSQVNYSYDSHRNLQSLTSSSGTTSFSYDSADRLTGITYPNGRSVQYMYNSNGQRISMADQSGFAVNYGYDAVGRLSRLSDGSGSSIVAYTYDAAGRIDRKTMGNGTYTTYSYNAAGSLLQLANHAANDSVNSSFTYTYDLLGRKTGMTAPDGIYAYSYDSAGQLIAVTPPVGGVIHYHYDAAGNRTTTTASGTTTSYSSNSLNEYTAVGGTTYSYDTDGNLIGKTGSGGTWSYQYDDENRLVSMTGDGVTWTYEYDGLGNRVAQTRNGLRTEYLIDPTGLGNVIAEYDGTGALQKHYTYGLDLASALPSGGTHSYYHFDGSGNTAQITGAAGSIQNSYTFLPFGEKISSSETMANPFTFVGQYGVRDDGNGLYNMRNRWYDPALGRFTRPDPLGIGGGDANLYRYVGNRPTDLVDPMGLDSVDTGRTISSTLVTMTNIALNQFAGSISDLDEFAVFKDTVTSLNIMGLGLSAAQFAYTAHKYNNGNADGLQLIHDGGKVGASSLFIIPLLATTTAGAGLVAIAPVVATVAVVAGVADLVTDKPLTWFMNYWYDSKANDPSNWGPRARNRVPVLSSYDPNLKITVGYGTQGYVTGDTTLQYTIDFENMSTATAAALKVVVTDQLNSNLDWSSMQLISYGFNNTNNGIPGGLQAYTGEAKVSTDPNPVKVNAAFNPATGLITWTMESFDPVTGGVPEDPYAGFLPPNDATHRGEGYVTFSIKPKPGLADGTAIANKATIVFDVNTPIDTNIVTNTIDLTIPTSSVNVLPTTTPASFTVSWGGSDTGSSGIAGYDVYVKTDNGAYIPWLTGTATTSATYDGVVGHSYAFYSIATDNVGHRQTQVGSVVSTTTSSTITKAGDCDANGTVTIAEVQSAINMFLGLKTVALCVDTNGDTTVSIAEVQKTINSFLGL
jgi:RHS repeat-associated protein